MAGLETTLQSLLDETISRGKAPDRQSSSGMGAGVEAGADLGGPSDSGLFPGSLLRTDYPRPSSGSVDTCEASWAKRDFMISVVVCISPRPREFLSLRLADQCLRGVTLVRMELAGTIYIAGPIQHVPFQRARRKAQLGTGNNIEVI